MNKIEKIMTAGIIFTAGYLIGFYEMKYKTLKIIISKATEESQK